MPVRSALPSLDSWRLRPNVCWLDFMKQTERSRTSLYARPHYQKLNFVLSIDFFQLFISISKYTGEEYPRKGPRNGPSQTSKTRYTLTLPLLSCLMLYMISVLCSTALTFTSTGRNSSRAGTFHTVIAAVFRNLYILRFCLPQHSRKPHVYTKPRETSNISYKDFPFAPPHFITNDSPFSSHVADIVKSSSNGSHTSAHNAWWDNITIREFASINDHKYDRGRWTDCAAGRLGWIKGFTRALPWRPKSHAASYKFDGVRVHVDHSAMLVTPLSLASFNQSPSLVESRSWLGYSTRGTVNARLN